MIGSRKRVPFVIRRLRGEQSIAWCLPGYLGLGLSAQLWRRIRCMLGKAIEQRRHRRRQALRKSGASVARCSGQPLPFGQLAVDSMGQASEQLITVSRRGASEAVHPLVQFVDGRFVGRVGERAPRLREHRLLGRKRLRVERVQNVPALLGFRHRRPTVQSGYGHHKRAEPDRVLARFAILRDESTAAVWQSARSWASRTERIST